MYATKIYIENFRAWGKGYRLIANKGGTRSGKTYSLMSLFVSVAVNSSKRRIIDVVSESLPHLKRGALNDIDEILSNEGLNEDVDYTLNRSDHIYTFNSGTQIRFFSADDWGKVKGSRRDVLFINECNRVNWEIYRQLAVRTTECIFLDWNPDSEFWYELKGLQGKDNTFEIHSTYKDNPFLTELQVQEIESNKGDENWWRVYGLGLTGMHQGLIYQNWEQCDKIPDGARLIGYGLDFGFVNDPTAIVAVYLHDGKLWIDELCYEKGLTNDKIAVKLMACEGDIVADSAELKSITEIYNYGIHSIEPAIKGQDSIRMGIQVLHRYKLMVTKRSLNIINELRNYKWKEDKITGEQRNEPIDAWNHALDALRYLAINKLSEKAIVLGGEEREITNGKAFVEVHPLLNGKFVYCRCVEQNGTLIVTHGGIGDEVNFDKLREICKGDVHIELPKTMLHYAHRFKENVCDAWVRRERGGIIAYIESFKSLVSQIKVSNSDELTIFLNNLLGYDGKMVYEAMYVLCCIIDRYTRANVNKV